MQPVDQAGLIAEQQQWASEEDLHGHIFHTALGASVTNSNATALVRQ
jgi:hypothetical protein